MDYKLPPLDWYKNIWDLGIKNQSWVESTTEQVDFIIKILGMTGKERILDLACGFGRHSLEFARRGYEVVGVDITADFITDATIAAENEGLHITFLCSDIRDLLYESEFDIVLNLADGAIGYLENDEENHKIFEIIAKALKPGGKSLMDICSQEHAILHFPKKFWEIGEKMISLPWFDYDEVTKRMLFGGFDIPLGEPVRLPENLEAHSSNRLYSFDEVASIFKTLSMKTIASYGDYNIDKPFHHKNMQLIIVSEKNI